MNKNITDQLCGAIFIIGLFALPFARKMKLGPAIGPTLRYAAFVFILVLIVKLIGYMTKYTAEERKADLKQFVITAGIAALCLLISFAY